MFNWITDHRDFYEEWADGIRCAVFKSMKGNSVDISYGLLFYKILKRLKSLWCIGLLYFCEARRASHCHSPQTTYSSTCCVLSAQKSAMHVLVCADRLTTQHSIVDVIDRSWSYWQILYHSWHVECFWPAFSLHTEFRLLHLPPFCHNIHGGK